MDFGIISQGSKLLVVALEGCCSVALSCRSLWIDWLWSWLAPSGRIALWLVSLEDDLFLGLVQLRLLLACFCAL